MPRSLLLLLILLLALTQQTLTPDARTVVQQKAEPRAQRAVESARRTIPTSDFARLIERLSEPGGYFDTDNLISNEASYLHVLSKMRELKVSGGAYIGVGPDQNFSYIAQIRPRIAFIIDIRRDNLLQHFLFKSLFALSRNRIEYLCLLFGKPAPDRLEQWDQRSIQQLIEYIDQTPARRDLFEATRELIQTKAQSFGLPLSAADLETIGRIHAHFYSGGLDLRFTSRNRAPRWYYPTYRDLLLERDLTGRQANYLASEGDFQFLKTIQARDLLIPVVGNLAGTYALAAIGRYLAERGERVSAFYTSNVEYYLMREGSFNQFAENVKLLPRDERSVIIRSFFTGSFGYSHPQSVQGYYSTQLLQTLNSLVKEYESGGYQSYWDVVNKHSLELR